VTIDDGDVALMGGRKGARSRARVVCCTASFLLMSMLMLGAPVSVRAEAPSVDAVAPVSRDQEPWWRERHTQKHDEGLALRPRLVLLGDSITHDYELSSPYAPYDFQRIWRRFYAPRQALNLGFNGDTTANVLWRIEHGALDGIQPALVILHVGTNDTIQGASALRTVQGITAVIDAVHQRLPTTPVLLVSLLPSRVSAQKDVTDREVNRLLAKRYKGVRDVTFVDVTALFLRDGAVNLDLFMDQRADASAAPLHPDAHAQERMAEYLEPFVDRLMRR
jgi:lysophospholipase L1-like esterase